MPGQAAALRLQPQRPRRELDPLGCIALGLMLLVEFTVVLWIRGMTIRGYFETRDPVSGAVYFLTLGAFALIPVFVGRPRA